MSESAKPKLVKLKESCTVIPPFNGELFSVCSNVFSSLF